MNIIVSEDLRGKCPDFLGACIEADVTNTVRSDELWTEIAALASKYASTLTTESLKTNSAISATRRVYRLCGKDPSRYRPSAEALVRRAIQGKSLYSVNTLVDLTNLVSMESGYSIGAFDRDMIAGDTLTLGIGTKDEPYEGIGRGPINIDGLPVYRDAVGGIGTPTTDHERTKTSVQTKRLVVLINGYDGNRQNVERAVELTRRLLSQYCSLGSFNYFFY